MQGQSFFGLGHVGRSIHLRTLTCSAIVLAVLGWVVSPLVTAQQGTEGPDAAGAESAVVGQEPDVSEESGEPAVQPPDNSAEELPAISEAETILWMGDQLRNIEAPSSLLYEFSKAGSLEEGFTDTIQFHITDLLDDGFKTARVDFFTGSRNHYVPPYDHINGNVLLAIYLEGDVIEMKRLTGGGGPECRLPMIAPRFAIAG